MNPPCKIASQLRHRLGAGRAGKHKAAWPEPPIELRLDRAEQLRRVLVLIDAHRRRAAGDKCRVCGDRLRSGRIVEVDHLDACHFGQLRQEHGLANGAWPLKHDNGLFSHACGGDFKKTTAYQPRGQETENNPYPAILRRVLPHIYDPLSSRFAVPQPKVLGVIATTARGDPRSW